MNAQPLWKALDAPLLALNESHVELFSLLVLFALTFMALLVRSRHRQWLRHVVQALSVAVFFFIVYSCLGVFGMIRNFLHGTTLIGTVFTESFFWMSLPLVVFCFSLTTGPYFCGWICPTGTFQELTAALREFISRRLFGRPRRQLDRIKPTLVGLLGLGFVFVGFLAFIFWMGASGEFYVEDSSLYWGAALFVLVFMVLIGRVEDRSIRVLRGLSFAIIVISALLKTAIVSPVHFAFASVEDKASMLTTLALVVASFFISRAWCRYVCPWGYFMGCVHRVSRLRIETKAQCVGCARCNAVCRVGAVEKGRVDLMSCQFCMACVDECSHGALEVVDTWRERREMADDRLDP